MGTHMKTTIEISDALLTEARALANKQGRTLRELVEAGLRHVVAEQRSKQRKFTLRNASVGGNGLQAGLRYENWDRILELAYEDRG
jgi:hypothetical protein